MEAAAFDNLIEDDNMIGKGIFHTHLVVGNLEKSLKFYTGLFGMQRLPFEDGTLVFLTTPGRDDLLALNPGGKWGYPGGVRQGEPARGRPCRSSGRNGALRLYASDLGRL